MTKVEICENKKHTTTFNHLRRGDCFWLDDNLFMKIYYNDIEKNSVLLETGETYVVLDSAEITPINSISICIKD